MKQSKGSLDEGTGLYALQITLHTVRYERDRVSPALRELHWLPVAERIQLCLLDHKSFLGHTPEYISDLLTSVTNIPGRSTLCASSCGNLVVPRTRRRIGDRAFTVAAPEQATDGAETAAIDGLVSS